MSSRSVRRRAMPPAPRPSQGRTQADPTSSNPRTRKRDPCLQPLSAGARPMQRDNRMPKIPFQKARRSSGGKSHGMGQCGTIPHPFSGRQGGPCDLAVDPAQDRVSDLEERVPLRSSRLEGMAGGSNPNEPMGLRQPPELPPESIQVA